MKQCDRILFFFSFFLSSKDVPCIAFPFAGPFVDLLIYQVTSSGTTTYRFFFKFGRDVLSAQVLGVNEAEELRVQIAEDLANNNVVPA